MCCNNMWCYIDMSHCEWAVCGYEGFLVLFSLLYVGLVRFIIRLKCIPVAAAHTNMPITQSSAPDDGHMVARNMLSNY